MTEQDVDDVAFLTGTNHKVVGPITHSICQSSPLIHNPRDLAGVIGNESNQISTKKSLYENHGIATCSHKKALCIATIVFAILFTAAIIIAFTGAQNDCTCARGKLQHYMEDTRNMTSTFIPRASNGQIFPWSNIRLPTFVKPHRYNLTIHPNLTTLEVRSQVSIEFQMEAESHFIILHSHNLSILDKMIQDRRGNNMTIVRVLDYPGAQQLYIETREKFKKRGNYTLRIRYNFKLNKEKVGFYITSYLNKDGFMRYLAATNFKPTYARTAFPCFDEPHLKAKFKITIFRDRFHISLFNTPIVNTDDLGFYMGTGLLRDDFLETREMSTYLVAFVICDYTQINRTSTETGVVISIYSPEPYMEQTSLSMNTATHILNYFENFFGLAFPLPKLDVVALSDFEGDALENWGLITFYESDKMLDASRKLILGKQWITSVIAHNLAHQWFGNLVTMKWWNDVWLVEGFTILFEYFGIDDYHPEWKMMNQFIIDRIQPALAIDALKNSHPISTIVSDPSKIDTIFDTMSLNKGAAILNMLTNFLELENLQNSLRDYLISYEYSTADTKDIWNVITRNINNTLDVKVIMDTWVNQMGFPLITLKREDREIVATQSRFLFTAKETKNEVSTTPSSKVIEEKWFIYLTYYTNNDSEVRGVWMNKTSAHFDVDPDIIWIKANVNQSGFYRVMYDEDMWQSLINTLKSKHMVFSIADRASLIDDAFSLCRAGILNATLVLDLSTYLVKETDYAPWASAIEHLKAWTHRLSESLAYKSLLKYIRYLIMSISKYLNSGRTKSHLEKLLSVKVASTAVWCGLNDTVSTTLKLFKNWMLNNQTIDPNLRESVYSAGVKYGSINEWQYCWDYFTNSTSTNEKTILLRALGSASDPWLLQRYLMKTLNKNNLYPEEVKVVLEVVAANPEGRLLAWRHLKAYWPTMYSLYGNDTTLIGHFIAAVTAHLSTPYDLYEVSTYFNGTDVGTAARILDQSLEIINLNINWIKNNEEEVNMWLRKFTEKKN